jgi:hypothetical protein
MSPERPFAQSIGEELCFLGTPAEVIELIRRLDQRISGLEAMGQVAARRALNSAGISAQSPH